MILNRFVLLLYHFCIPGSTFLFLLWQLLRVPVYDFLYDQDWDDGIWLSSSYNFLIASRFISVHLLLTHNHHFWSRTSLRLRVRCVLLPATSQLYISPWHSYIIVPDFLAFLHRILFYFFDVGVH